MSSNYSEAESKWKTLLLGLLAGLLIVVGATMNAVLGDNSPSDETSQEVAVLLPEVEFSELNIEQTRKPVDNNAINRAKISARQQSQSRHQAKLQKIKQKNVAHENRLTAIAGASAEQRARIRQLVAELDTRDPIRRESIQHELFELHEEADVYQYLSKSVMSLSPPIAQEVLSVMAVIEADKTYDLVKQISQEEDPALRIVGIEFFKRHLEQIPGDPLAYIARGMVDEADAVQTAAAGILAELGAVRATPVLLDSIDDTSEGVANASRNALQTLWSSKLSEGSPQSKEDWYQFLGTQSYPNPIRPEGLFPLYDPNSDSVTKLNSGT